MRSWPVDVSRAPEDTGGNVRANGQVEPAEKGLTARNYKLKIHITEFVGGYSVKPEQNIFSQACMVAKERYRTIGIMGGMGPTTSIQFYSRIIKLFQEKRGAKYNFEFPEIILHNIPAPDNVVAGVTDELLKCMEGSVVLLERAGVDFIAIPCNSAHGHINALTRVAKIPILNILEETAKKVGATGVDKVLILGTKSTLNYGLYQRHLLAWGITPIIPTEPHQDALTRLIVSVCEGSCSEASTSELSNIIAAYPEAEGVILGCTELPAIFKPNPRSIAVFDSLEILSLATFAACVGSTNTS